MIQKLTLRKLVSIQERIEHKRFDSLSHKYRYLATKFGLTICQIQRIVNKTGQTNYYNILNVLNADPRRYHDSF